MRFQQQMQSLKRSEKEKEKIVYINITTQKLTVQHGADANTSSKKVQATSRLLSLKQSELLRLSGGGVRKIGALTNKLISITEARESFM